jgi:hypothetical protein
LKTLLNLLGILSFVLLFACGEKAPEKAVINPDELGIGPINTELKMDPINPALAEKGKAIFDSKCAACHKYDTRYVGPALKGITTRRRPEFIMNMILNPIEMTQKNPFAKELLGQFMTQMTNQNITQEDARAILENFRNFDSQK